LRAFQQHLLCVGSGLKHEDTFFSFIK